MQWCRTSMFCNMFALVLLLYDCMTHRKDILTRTIESKSLDDIQEGIIPGDGRGAGGLDTYFFSHLTR